LRAAGWADVDQRSHALFAGGVANDLHRSVIGQWRLCQLGKIVLPARAPAELEGERLRRLRVEQVVAFVIDYEDLSAAACERVQPFENRPHIHVDHHNPEWCPVRRMDRRCHPEGGHVWLSDYALLLVQLHGGNVDPSRRKNDRRFEEPSIGFWLQLMTTHNARSSHRRRSVNADYFGAIGADDPELIVRALCLKLGQVARGHSLAPGFLCRPVDRIRPARKTGANDAFQRHRRPKS
jgi:hypothetical protein